MGFANSIIGGAATLIRAAVQSANFVHNVSGWQIAKTGSAEFNSVTIRGSLLGTDFLIDSAGDFFLLNSSGNTVALVSPNNGGAAGWWIYQDSGAVQGPLIASGASKAGTDSVTGTAFLQGMTSYAGNAYAQLISGALNFQGAAGQFAPGQVFTNNLSGLIELGSGQKTAGDAPALLDLVSTVASGVGKSQAIFSVDQNILNGTVSCDSGAISSDGSGNLTIGQNLNLTPKMATPPNTAAVKAGTATLAQTEACLGALIGSMQNRNMVT